MADKLMRAQVSIPRVNGNPEDTVTNTWYFDGDDGLVDSIYHAHVMTKLTAFYQSVDQFLSGMNSPTATVKIYDMRDPEPRVPEYTDTIALTFGTGDWYPAEIAICVSFQADPVSGESQKRRRGRIYLGPIAHDPTYTENTGEVRIASTCRDAIASAAGALAVATGEEPGPKVSWSVYSPTTDLTSTVDDAFHDVQSGWVDSAYDIQRRRGAKPAARSLFS